MEKECCEVTGRITVTDGLRTVVLPFSEEETLLPVLKQYLYFASPCNGAGFCGQCRFDRVLPDGTLKPELACMFTPTDGLTVKIPLVRVKDPAKIQ